MAGYSVQSIDGLIGRSLRTGGKQQSQMRTSRLGDHPYLLGIDATLPGLTAYQAHGTLSIPAPATAAIIEAYGIPVAATRLEGELCTPTSAAILAHFVDSFS